MPTATHAPRILIVRLSSMGDVVHALPAVAALRRANPAAHIGWAIEPAWAHLVDASLVDTVHLVPFKRWSRSLHSATTWRAMAAMRRQLRSARYAVAVDMQGNLRSGVVTEWSGAARRIGEQHPRESIARWFSNERIGTHGAHVIEQDLELASAAFGEPLPYTPPPLPRVAAADNWAEETLTTHSAAHHALLLPGAGWGSKRWPAERYGEVAIALRDLGFRCWVNAGPGEQQLANKVVAASAGAATTIAPALPQMIAMLRHCQLCIGGDTGPLHLANAMHVPVVGIYGPTDPARNGPFMGTGGAKFRVLRSPASVPNYSHNSMPEAGLLTITAGEVVAAARDLLQ